MLAHKIFIDWDIDGSFDTAGDDISDYWQSTDIRAGLLEPNDHCAAVGRCTIRLNNEDKRFSPDYAAGPYYGKLKPYRPAKVVAYQDGAEIATLFRGVVEGWYPDSGHVHGARGCTLELMDFMGVLQSADMEMPLQESETAKTLLDKICARAFAGATATNTLTVTDGPTDGDTITVGARVYTLKTTLTGAEDEILIGTALVGTNTLDVTAQNIAAAIQANTGAGTTYGTNTTRHQYVTADYTIGAGLKSASVAGWVALRDAAVNNEALGCQWISFPASEYDQGIEISAIKLYLRKQGAPAGTCTLRIETLGGNGTPSGTLFDTNATGTFSESDITAGGGWLSVSLTDAVVFDPYVDYFLVLTTDRGSSGVNYIEWGHDNAGAIDSPHIAKQKTAGVWSSVLSGGNICYSGIWINSTVSLSANTPGAWGNSLALSTTSGELTAGGATFSGGTDAPSGLTSFETGQTFPIAGDTWAEGRTNGLAAVQDVADSEYGLFWAARDGTLTFKDYQWIFEQLPTSVSLTLTDTPDAIRPRVALSDITNEIGVEYTPRRTSSAGVVVATANGDIEIPARAGGPGSSPGSVVVRLTNMEATTGNVVGATSVIAPVATTDYKVYARVTGDGTTLERALDVTSKDKVRISLDIKGGAIEATFYNKAWVPLWVSDFQVRGTALIAYDRQTMIASDSTSISAYGRRTRRIRLPFPSDNAFAEAIAGYELNRNKDPRTMIDNVSFRGTTTLNSTHLYSLELGNIVALTDTQTGISAKRYMIIGWSCGIQVGGSHTLTWTVRRMDDPATWILENASYSQIGTTTVLAL